MEQFNDYPSHYTPSEGIELDAFPEQDENIWPWSGAARCTFNTLDPIADGVDDYHFNSFIAFFRAPSGFNPAASTRQLFNDFPRVLSHRNRAVVTRMQCAHNGLPTLRFTFDAPGPNLHSDWVNMQTGPVSFFARTLERRWYNAAEMALGPVTALSGLTIPGIFGRIGVDINRRHFLAGRRSWRVGRAPTGGDLFYVETAAFERYSHLAYLAASHVIPMRQAIVDIWTILLRNFLTMNRLTPVSYVPTGYSTTRGVAHREASHSSASTLRGQHWIARSLARHRGL